MRHRNMRRLAALALVVALAAPAGDWEGAVARLSRLVEERPGDAAASLALAELYATAPEGPLSRPREALALLVWAPRWYGEGEETRLRALDLLGEREQARRVFEESPFLGRAEREALAPLDE